MSRLQRACAASIAVVAWAGPLAASAAFPVATATAPPAKTISPAALTLVGATPPPAKSITTATLTLVARAHTSDLRAAKPTISGESKP